MANNTANRGAVWTDTEVQALISVWSDSTVQNELDGAVRNKLVFQKVAQRLREKNVNRDWKQCRDKVKNLKTKYREVKDHNAETGRGRQNYKFYEQLDCILVSRARPDFWSKVWRLSTGFRVHRNAIIAQYHVL